MTEDEQIRRILIYEVQRLGYVRVRETNLYTKGLKNIRIMFIRNNPVLKFEYIGSHVRLGFDESHEIPRYAILDGKSREIISKIHDEFNKKVEKYKRSNVCYGTDY